MARFRVRQDVFLRTPPTKFGHSGHLVEASPSDPAEIEIDVTLDAPGLRWEPLDDEARTALERRKETVRLEQGRKVLDAAGVTATFQRAFDPDVRRASEEAERVGELLRRR
ncbi:MAG: hypothetical protein LAO51_14725 [Acidobacteriia bacterium]|nr:hypothetical protein [Terriglobia bacterium]